RHENVDSGFATRLDEGRQLQIVEDLPQPARGLAYALKTGLVQEWLTAARLAAGVQVWVQVEHHEVGIVEHRRLQLFNRSAEGLRKSRGIGPRVGTRVPWMQLEIRRLSEPHE